MENKHFQNINLIIDSIGKQSEKEQKLLEDASEKLYKEKYEALKKEISAKYRKQTEYELAKLALSANKRASELEADHKAKISALREKITSEVYAKARESIESFTQGESYEPLLINSAKKISTLYDGAVKVYLRSTDMKYKEVISEVFGKTVSFYEDNTIILGGLKVLFANCDVLVDDTLDSRMEVTKKDFAKNSGLGFVG